MCYYVPEIVNQLKKAKKIVLYGARIVANEVSQCLMGEPYNLEISNFIVSDLQDNPKMLNGVKVIDIREAKTKYLDALVIIAVLEKYLSSIINTLKENGFTNILPVTFESNLWSLIRGNYFREMRLKQDKEYLTLEEELNSIQGYGNPENIRVYMAKCHTDRKIDSKTNLYDWEIPIQAGAALTKIQIADIRDNQGHNISSKNQEYCELTALYWIWQNDREAKYAGLCHYRRRFELNKQMLSKLDISDIDVIVTIPILNFPNVVAMYNNDHCKRDWNIMMEGIKTIHPEYFLTALNVQNGCYYYAYNMFIARKEILDKYCEWLFPILKYCEDRCEKKGDNYQNRFIGFLAERLLSIYFIQNENHLKIVHARKIFLDD